MAKPKTKHARKKRGPFETASPTDAQMSNGRFDLEFVTHTETNTKARAYRRESCLVEKWVQEGGVGFDIGAQRAIADCVTFWGKMASPRLTAAYGEHVAASTGGEGYGADDAANEIAFRKSLVPAPYWNVFENVVRHNEPAGVAGSSFAKNPAQQIASAKTIVGMVASVLAMKLGY